MRGNAVLGLPGCSLKLLQKLRYGPLKKYQINKPTQQVSEVYFECKSINNDWLIVNNQY